MRIILFITIIFFPICLLSQSSNSDKDLTLNLQAGYLFPQNIDKGQTTEGGIEIRPSIHYRITQTVTFLLEYNYSRHKFYNMDYSGYVNRSLINFGLRIFPKSEERFYLKTALGIPLAKGHDFQYIPTINLGIGNDINISKKVDLFGEAETYLSILNAFSLSYSLSAGIKYKLF